jgi:hypothetical protein
MRYRKEKNSWKVQREMVRWLDAADRNVRV